MQAVILAGGLGTRMSPLTDHLPKPLLPLVGRPILAHITARLAQAGVTRTVLATGHLAQAFTPAVLESLNAGMTVVVSNEQQTLGTGGGLRQALDLVTSGRGEPVVVVNGDSLSRHDLRRHVAIHAARRSAFTVHVRHVEDARGLGLVDCEERGRVVRFQEKPIVSVAGLVNAGTYVAARPLVEELAEAVEMSLERDALPTWVEAGVVWAYREDCYVADLGTPSAYLATTRDLLVGTLATDLALDLGERGGHPLARISPSADVKPGSYVGARATVGPRAFISASVVLEGARVGAGARVTDSIVGPGATVPAGALVTGAVLVAPVHA